MFRYFSKNAFKTSDLLVYNSREEFLYCIRISEQVCCAEIEKYF